MMITSSRPMIATSVATALVLGAASLAQSRSQRQAVAPTDPRLQEAISWYTGVGGTVDDAKAHSLLLEALEDNDPISRMWLARCYSRGRMEFERDEQQAAVIAGEVLGQIEQLAARDVVEAVFLLGTAHDEGIGMPTDAGRAMAWFHRAADQNHVLAQHNLGNAYLAGRGVPQSDELAVYWWRRAADQGDAIPQWQLGKMYEAGRGVSANLPTALSWYRQSAARGNLSARQALERLGES